jgi:hypothetical protein
MSKLLPGSIWPAVNRSGNLAGRENLKGIQQELALHGCIPWEPKRQAEGKMR